MIIEHTVLNLGQAIDSVNAQVKAAAIAAGLASKNFAIYFAGSSSIQRVVTFLPVGRSQAGDLSPGAKTWDF